MNYYKEAVAHFVDLSTNDPTSGIAKENALIGLSALLECYDRHGLDSKGVFLVALPDFTFTRNKLRWEDGFSYGCIIFCGDVSIPLIPLGFRPNCCGVLLVEIPGWDGNEEKLYSSFIESLHSHKGISMDDFSRGNHFISVLRMTGADRHFFLLHGSFSRIKEDIEDGYGLYIDRSSYWRSKVISLNNGILSFPYLVESDAREYYDCYLEHESFSNEMMLKIARDLWGEPEIVFHNIHEGFHNQSTILLGCYVSARPFESPIMLSPDADMPVVKTYKTIDQLTNSKVDVDLYCTPHGGGYELAGVTEFIRKQSNRRMVNLVYGSTNKKLLTNNLLSLPFAYRKNVAEEWCIRYRAAEHVSSLNPIFSAKV